MSVDWEARYRSGDTPWEKGAGAPPLEEFLARERVTGRVLVPGCGSGHDVRLLAAQGAQVVGLDLAPAAIQRAAAHAAVAGETYVLGDFFALPREWSGAFDAVFEHTCFCAIDPARRDDYVRSLLEVLRPGGLFVAVFYLEPGHDPDAGPPWGVSRRELDERFGPHFTVTHDFVPARAYPGREGRELVRCHVRRGPGA
jgi:SAM-dependent methyltransferase